MAEITIDNSRLNAMRNDATMVAKFPFLSLSITKQAACCHHRTSTIPDYDGIRRAIAGLTPDKREEFKQVLSADKVTVYVPSGSSTEVVTF